MSSDGGDAGGFDPSGSSTGPSDAGGGKGTGTGAGDTGAVGKGAGDTSGATGGASDYGGYTPSTPDVTGGVTPDVTGSPMPDVGGATSTTPDSTQWSGPSINDFVSPDVSGFNLAGPGPVGGDTPLAAHGDVFSTDASGTIPLTQDTNAMGVTAPTSGPGTSAAAFAAPSGVTGVPQLDNLVSAPMNASGATPDNQNVFDSLNAAQTGAANQYADVASASVPSAPDDTGSTTLAASTPASASGTPAATGTGSSSTPSSTGGPGSPQTTGILPGISNSSLGAATAGVGLLNNLTNGNQAPAGSPALNATATAANTTAAQQTAAGTALQQYIASGTLPAGYEDQVQQAAQSARQTIISNYANRGLPTDPTRNSALAQELTQVDARLPAMREQLAQQLATAGTGMVANGLQATGISSGIYQNLANLQNSQQQQRAQAIANFASSLNSGTRPSTTRAA